ncbi:MAG: TRAP transporter small permease subunit [Gammaproteobacteria bacterium]|nr:TRAP transporter small permease subunit [Gammaproteobacteria bacterium]
MSSRNSHNLIRVIQIKLDQFSEITGSVISWLLLLMMLVTSLVVFMRYLLNMGSIAMQESVTYMHGIVFLLGIAYALKKQAHVRVDILYQNFSIRTQALVDLLGTILFLIPFAAFVTWVSIEYVSFSWSLQESSPEPGGLPGVFLLKTLIPIMSITLMLQGISELIRNALIVLGSEKDLV